MPPVKYTNKPIPAPSPQQPIAEISNIENKIKRIENLLEQLEYERDLSIALNKEDDAKNLYGRIVGLSVALAILKEEIRR